MVNIGIIGYGIVGEAVAHGFSDHSIKYYDKFPGRIKFNMVKSLQKVKTPYKTYSYLFLAIIIAFVLSFNRSGIFSLEEMSLFLTVVGLIYGLIAAFTINSAWERFSKIRDEVAIETGSLVMAYIFTKKLSDKVSARKFKSILKSYCEDVPKIEWHNYWEAESTHRKFRALIELVAGIKIVRVGGSKKTS